MWPVSSTFSPLFSKFFVSKWYFLSFNTENDISDIVTKYLREKQIIVVAVLTFGLAWWTIVISFVLQDHTAPLQHVKSLVIVGIDLSYALFFPILIYLNFPFSDTIKIKLHYYMLLLFMHIATNLVLLTLEHSC